MSMNTVIKLPEFRYLISLSSKNTLNFESEEISDNLPSVKKTNFLTTAIDIASSDPRAHEIIDSHKGQVIFIKRKLF